MGVCLLRKQNRYRSYSESLSEVDLLLEVLREKLNWNFFLNWSGLSFSIIVAELPKCLRIAGQMLTFTVDLWFGSN